MASVKQFSSPQRLLFTLLIICTYNILCALFCLYIYIIVTTMKEAYVGSTSVAHIL